MMKRLLPLALLSGLLFGMPIALAEESGKAKSGAAVPSEMLKDPYIVTLLQIGLKKKQSGKFKNLIQEYAVKRGKAIDKTRRQYSGPIDVALDNAIVKVRTKWVKKVDRLLDDDQMTRFPAFLEQLDLKLASQLATDETVEADQAWEFN